MKEIEFSRRNMIALTGAGLAAATVAACSDPGGSSVGGGENEAGFDNHGDDPNGASATERVPFNPKFMSLVHLTSGGAWGVSSNDAHFEFVQPSYDKAGRTKHACAIFANKIKQGWRRFSEAPRGSPFQVYDRTPDAPRPDFADELEFVRFGFGQQHDVYVFFEHAPGEISVDSIGKRLLSFSGHLLDGKKADPNHAFFDAEVISDLALLGDLAGLGTLIRFNNLCTVKDDKGYHSLPYGDIKSQEYKLNIFYKAKSGIAMAIDPDTGNGHGNEP